MKIPAQILYILPESSKPNTQPEQKVKMKVTVEFEPGDEITKAGVEFLVAKSGETIDAFALDAFLSRLEMEEDAATGQGYFEKLRCEQVA